MSSFSDRMRVRPLAGVLALASLLGACSDLYYDRREAIQFGSGDAVAHNIAVQTIDPWPPAAANRRIPGQGPTTAIAIERWRTGNAIPPRGLNTTSSDYRGQQGGGADTLAAASAGGASTKP